MAKLKDKDMFVSVKKFKKELKKIEVKHSDEIKELRSEIENGFYEEKDCYRDSINRMKELYVSPSVLYATPPSSPNFYTQLGVKTKLFVDGFALYTGDEVQVDGGSFGIADIDRSGNVYIKTNKTHYDVIEEYAHDSMPSFRDVMVTKLKITKHFNEMVEGDVVAKGRKGGFGFKIGVKGE